jgi:predicted phosphodiesterase
VTAPRVAALYDVHGNLPALEAVLAELDAVAPDAAIVVGGDFANGPFPAETVDRLRALGGRALFIRGNGERELLEGRADAEEAWAARTAFVAGALSREQRAFLAALAETRTLDVDRLGRVLFCHGSPRSDAEIVTYLTHDERLRPMLDGVAEPVVVLGHTHSQFDRVLDGTRIVNAGSVGMPYEGEPGAYWALLGPDVELRRTPYDLEAAAERIRASGFPAADELASDYVLTVVSREEASTFFEGLALEQAS